jgi:Domain of unknown function (DUF4397)
MKFRLRVVVVLGSLFVGAGCGASSSNGSAMPAAAGTVRARFVEGAPVLETLINGVPQNIGTTVYLRVDGQTLSSSFNYGTMTQFLIVPAGAHSLEVLNSLGYRVGPCKISALTAGKDYTLILIGSYPNYRVLSFEEPSGQGSTQLSLYEASPSVPRAGFGSFTVSNHSNFKQLGSTKLGNVATVSTAKRVSNFGGYVVGQGSTKYTVTPSQVDGFDKHDALPFHSAARLSLFFFDAGGSSGPVFGSLDR